MRDRFERELMNLKKELLYIGSLTEKAVESAVKAFLNKKKELADKVIEADKEIDLKEVQFEEECLKVLALYQPVALDLRVIVAYLKINNDLERIGDLAVNIARKAVYINQNQDRYHKNFDFLIMSDKSQKMLKQSLDALVNMDLELAEKILKQDKKVNKLKKKFRKDIIALGKKNSENLDILLRVHSFIRQLERISDMATNIAEDVIYITSGKIVRHNFEKDYLEDKNY